MPVHNADVAAVFTEMADRLDIQGDNPFRIRAYRNAARTVQDLGRELADMVGKGEDLTELSGIGKDLAEKIREIVATGTTPALEKLRRDLPAGITELLRVPNLGPKRVKTLYQDLRITTLAQLDAAARAGHIRDLPGFGEKIEQNILESLQARADSGRRFLRAAAAPYARALVEHLAGTPGVSKVTVAGSFRRARETVGDLDILAVAAEGRAIMERFTGYDEVKEVLARGDTKSSVVLRSGIQVDLRVVAARSFGSALHYFTGSKAHNIAIRKLGQQRGLKVNEYGVFRGAKYLAGRTEEDVYERVGLPFIPPELRENAGEIEAARGGGLPRLVGLEDIRGDLHVHTKASDGQQTVREMAEAARRRGYDYVAICDHSKRLAMVGGLDERRLRGQMEEIERLNGELKGIRVLKAIEVDILEDGSLDLSDGVLGELDLVVAAVHSHFRLPEEQQTARILKAMDRPHFSVLAHPTGRLLLERDPYAVEVERVIRHAAERGCFLELNAHPMRLDLNDAFCRLCKEAGVLVAISTDSHSVQDLDFMAHGIGQARRGWLEKKDVLNTRTWAQLKPLLARTMGGRSG